MLKRAKCISIRKMHGGYEYFMKTIGECHIKKFVNHWCKEKRSGQPVSEKAKNSTFYHHNSNNMSTDKSLFLS
jgi:hypothetical protein